MQSSSRDSSIWRSLALAFGDGVAFGVGVKLSQAPQLRSARGPAAAAPGNSAPAPSPAPLAPFTERLEQLEKRIHSMEHAPAPAAPPAAPAPFDQKVLEAVVNALDARLKEQAGQVERRLTELEARIAIELKHLARQDQTVAASLQTRLEDAHGQYNEHITAIRDAVAQDMDVLYGQIAQLRATPAGPAVTELEARVAAAVAGQLEARLTALQGDLELKLQAAFQEQLKTSLEAASARIAASTAENLSQQLLPIHADLAEKGRDIAEMRQRLTDGEKMAAATHEQLQPIHAALAERNREIAEMRQRLAENEQTVLDLILAIGDMCRHVANRIPAPAVVESQSEAAVPGPAVAAAQAAAETKAEPPAEPPSPPPSEPPAAAGPPETPSQPEQSADGDSHREDLNGHAPIPPMPVNMADTPVPHFTQLERPSRLWRIPLVSSFLILAIGSLTLLR